MIVVNTQPFQLVYTLVENKYLGIVLEPHVVQVNSLGNLSLTHQRIFSKTASYFQKNIQESDIEIIKLLDEMDDDFVFRKFYRDPKKKIRKQEFFQKHCSEEKMLQEIRPFIENRMQQALSLLRGKTIYKTGNDNNPASVPLTISPEKASVLFHFRKDENGTRYFPTIKLKGQRVEFMYKGAQIIGNSPCWMVLGNDLFDFEKEVEGKKLLPFLNKRFIQIPPATEESYYRKFVCSLIERYDVYAEGFDIKTHSPEPKAQLLVHEMPGEMLTLRLQFAYGDTAFDYDFPGKVKASLSVASPGKFTFYRSKRNPELEQKTVQFLESLGLIRKNRSYFNLPKLSNLISSKTKEGSQLFDDHSNEKYELLNWLQNNHTDLTQHAISIVQGAELTNYYIGSCELNVEINERNDWFDVTAVVCFGKFKFPFIALKEYILKGKKEFMLPDGKIAIIPEEWFGTLAGMLEHTTSDDSIRIEKFHAGLLDEIVRGNSRSVNLGQKLKELQGFDGIESQDVPELFMGNLRPYQQAGFDWFYFLKKHQFGGCLADDMGLGKTIQTLALLQKEKELFEKQAQFTQNENPVPHRAPSFQLGLFDAPTAAPNNRDWYEWSGGVLPTGSVKTQADKDRIVEQLDKAHQTFYRTSMIIVPNSLVFNWYKEALKFTPGLRILIHTGVNRTRSNSNFAAYDLIITTYGTARVDASFLQEFRFNYLILDESQSIKNPASLAAKAVANFKSSNRLILSGTPIENALSELWSQFSFINPGLLGTLSEFNERYAIPIEKQKNEQRMQQLKAIIKPFILRRTKEQVASDLPVKTEQIIFCEMSEEQRNLYEDVKSKYRNEILLSIKENGLQKTRFTLLQGLSRLRQIANHPKLFDAESIAVSGKFEELVERAETVRSQNHKVLLFSQYVSQLKIYRRYLDERGIRYLYLDGTLPNKERMRLVDEFQQNAEIPFFLISLKAGGVGLNLTSASYVFMNDPWWNPAVERQAIDRTHRIGQDKPVFIYKFITRDTVEEKILALQEKKSQLAGSLIESEESFLKTIDVDEILELLS